MTASRLDVTPDQYLADPCDAPSLSPSIAKILIGKSPLHAWTEHPKLGNMPRPASAAMNQGQLIHALLLNQEDRLVSIKADDFRTKQAQEARDAATAEGKTAVLEHVYADAYKVCIELRFILAEQGVELQGDNEVAISWQEGDAHCRTMIDYVDFDLAQTIEIKTISSADSGTCSRQSFSLGYDIQYAAHIAALNALRPDLAGRWDYRFAFIEMDVKRGLILPPYSVVCRQPDGAFEEMGLRRWAQAVKLWSSCIKSNNWPGYDVTPLTLPGWAMAQMDEFV